MSTTNLSSPQSSVLPSRHSFELPTGALQELHSSPPIDRGALTERCLGNLEFAMTLLDEFHQSSQSRLDTLETAAAEGNLAAIRSEAHGLKGVAGVLAANTLKEHCTNLEAVTKDEDWNQIRDLIQQLRHEMQRIIDFIPTVGAMK